MKYKILDTYKREGSYEILYEVYDDSGNLLVGNLIQSMGKNKPTTKDIDDIFNNLIYGQIISIIAEPVFLYYYNTDEITQILRDKKYFTPTEVFSEEMSVKL